MSYFLWLSIALLAATLIYYLIFAGLIWYWHEKKTSVIVVPMIFTFEFFITGFFVICIVSLTLQYGPDIFQAISNSNFSISPI